MKLTRWSKPWNKESETEEAGPNWSPLKATFKLEADALPSNITSISASIDYIDDNKDLGILNFYGIKNYLISQPDR